MSFQKVVLAKPGARKFVMSRKRSCSISRHIKLCQNIQIKSFSLKDIMLGKTDEEDLFINHILFIAKKHIYWCRCIKVKPSIITFTAQVKKIYQLETSIAKSSNK